MIVRNLLVASTLALAFTGTAFAQDSRAVEGDTLLIERVQQENTAAMPARGMTMQQVEAKFGAPSSKLDPRGGQKQAWPTINRWTYPTFTTPRSTRPVTTVPRPEIENTSSTGIRNAPSTARSGVGM